ncbi:hypothetical protein [Flavobacterium sp.]|uniref:hypothetical protein n=1 Tax=Flavobacterium sp. TaxID=239 RepID=UPI003263474D
MSKRPRVFRKKITFTIAIRHTGDKEFEDKLNSMIVRMVSHHGYDPLDHILGWAVQHLLRKNGHGDDHKDVYDKMIDWGLESAERGRLIKR